MHITDMLLKYRLPLFQADGEGAGAVGDAGGSDAGGADAGSQGDDAGGDQGGDNKTILGADKQDADDKGADGADGEKNSEGKTKDGEDGSKDDSSDDSKDGKKEDNTDQASTEIKLEAPEGMEAFQGEFDTFSTEATDWMKENPEATAADAFKWAAERQAQAVSTQTQETAEGLTQTITDWEASLKSDKDLGGDAYDANMAIAAKTTAAYGSEEIVGILNETGLGSHPAFVKMFHKIGLTLKDADVHAGEGGNKDTSRAESLASRYPKSKSS